MKLKTTLSILTALICATATQAAQNFIVGDVRYHTDHSVYSALPFADGDLSYGLIYEARDSNGALQLGVDYAPSVTGSILAEDAVEGTADPDIDYVATPMINLIFEDGIFVGGTGIRWSYIATEDDEEWSDMYWQLQLGLRFDLGEKIAVGVNAYYPFESWSDISDYDFDDMEYSASLSYGF